MRQYSCSHMLLYDASPDRDRDMNEYRDRRPHRFFTDDEDQNGQRVAERRTVRSL